MHLLAVYGCCSGEGRRRPRMHALWSGHPTLLRLSATSRGGGATKCLATVDEIAHMHAQQADGSSDLLQLDSGYIELLALARAVLPSQRPSHNAVGFACTCVAAQLTKPDTSRFPMTLQ